MSNQLILETLLVDIQHFAISRQNRSDFAINFIEAIEALEDVPFEVIDQARDWEYRIETEGYVDGAGYEGVNHRLFAELKAWVTKLKNNYS